MIAAKIYRETGLPAHLREKLGLEQVIEIIQEDKSLDKEGKEVLIGNLEEEARLQKEISEISSQPVKIFENELRKFGKQEGGNVVEMIRVGS